MPHHILFVTDILYTTRAGAEGVLSRVTRLLPSERYRCSIATFAPHPDRVPRDEFDCPVHLFPLRRSYTPRALVAALQLARLIRTEKVSLVHTFFPSADLLGGLVAKLCGCRVVSSRRDMGFQRSRWLRLAYRAAGPVFDQVQAVSESVRARHMRDDKLSPTKVVTVYNGVDLAEIDGADALPASEAAWLPSGTPRVVCVANLRPVKAIEVLIRAAALVIEKEPEARFLVAGASLDSQYYRDLVGLIRSLDLVGKVVLCGPIRQIPGLLKVCDVFYLPSRSEGLSNALLEAMACRLPCIANQVGGNPELIQSGRNGFLIPPDAPAIAADRILTLLRDRRLARRMGEEGRRMVEAHFTVQAMVRRMTALYDDLLGSEPASVEPIPEEGQTPHLAACLGRARPAWQCDE